MTNDNDLLLDPRVLALIHRSSMLAISQTAHSFADVVRRGELPGPMAAAFCGLNSCVGEDGKEVVGAHDLCLVLEVLTRWPSTPHHTRGGASTGMGGRSPHAGSRGQGSGEGMITHSLPSPFTLCTLCTLWDPVGTVWERCGNGVVVNLRRKRS